MECVRIAKIVKNVRYIFFGTPRFAEIVLNELIKAGYPPSLVVCNPDRPTGRKKTITPPPVKVVARKNDLNIWQPEKVTKEGLMNELSSLDLNDIDLFIVAAYGQILKKDILEFPKFGAIGIHPSLLPKYRGATPIRSAILNGEKETGVTLYLMDEGVDSGPVLKKEHVNISNDTTYEELHDVLATLGAKMTLEVAPLYLKGNISPKAQDEKEATITKKISTNDAKIDHQDLVRAIEGDKDISRKIHDTIRSLNPEPGAWVKVEGDHISGLPKDKRVKLLSSYLQGDKLHLKKIQVEGKKAKEIS